MAKKQDPLKLGKAAAIVSAAIMLIMGILGNLGIYTNAVQVMQQWHMFFDLSIVGIIAGMVEAAIIGFIIAYVFVWVYNKLE
jgi:hypothetical protein